MLLGTLLSNCLPYVLSQIVGRERFLCTTLSYLSIGKKTNQIAGSFMIVRIFLEMQIKFPIFSTSSNLAKHIKTSLGSASIIYQKQRKLTKTLLPNRVVHVISCYYHGTSVVLGTIAIGRFSIYYNTDYH